MNLKRKVREFFVNIQNGDTFSFNFKILNNNTEKKYRGKFVNLLKFKKKDIHIYLSIC